MLVCGFVVYTHESTTQPLMQGVSQRQDEIHHCLLAAGRVVSTTPDDSGLQPEGGILSTQPRTLVLYTILERNHVDDVNAKNHLEIPENRWHIGLREIPDEALWRAQQVDAKPTKDTHVIPR